MSEKCFNVEECGYGYGENEFPDECEYCGEYFCEKCLKKHRKKCKLNWETRSSKRYIREPHYTMGYKKGQEDERKRIKEEIEKKISKLEQEQIELHYTEMDKCSNDGEIRGLKIVLALLEEEK